MVKKSGVRRSPSDDHFASSFSSLYLRLVLCVLLPLTSLVEEIVKRRRREEIIEERVDRYTDDAFFRGRQYSLYKIDQCHV